MTYLKQNDNEILCSSSVFDMPSWLKGIYIVLWLLQAFFRITQDDAKQNFYLFYITAGAFWSLVASYAIIKKYTIQKNIKKIDNQQVIREVTVLFSFHTTPTEQDKRISKIGIDWHHAGMNLNIKSSITDKNTIRYLTQMPEKVAISKKMQLVYCKSEPYLYYLRF